MNTEVDERTQLAKTQIDATSYWVLNWGLAAILIYRFFILKQGLSANWDIFLLAVIQGYVRIFLNQEKGILPTRKQRSIRWIKFAIIAAILSSISISSAFSYGFHLDILTISSYALPVGFVLFALFLFWVERQRYRRWERSNLEGHESEE